MYRNLDIKIKNATIQDFLSHYAENKDKINLMLRKKGYLSGFIFDTLTNNNIVLFNAINGNSKIKSFFLYEKDNDLFIHDDYLNDKDSFLLNRSISIFSVLRTITETFEEFEFSEYFSKQPFQNTTTFPYFDFCINEDKAKKYKYDNETKLISLITKTQESELYEER